MYKRIVVPVDGSDLAEIVLPHVESIAGNPAVEEVVFLHVLETFPSSIPGGDLYIREEDAKRLREQHRSEAEKYLESLKDKVGFLGGRGKFEIIGGKTEEAIIEYAMKSPADLIIMATHGRSGVTRWMLGSVAERVLRWSCVPVLIVRPPECTPKI